MQLAASACMVWSGECSRITTPLIKFRTVSSGDLGPNSADYDTPDECTPLSQRARSSSPMVLPPRGVLYKVCRKVGSGSRKMVEYMC
eukprot:3788382-Pyramimonas_sp.AAC.1